MTTPLARELELALELADVADAITVARYRASDLVVETKPDLTPVTEADQAAERAIRDLLTARRPNDVVSGEEFGEVSAGEYRWILDPIDGTKNYVRGVPVWATLIALEIRGALSVAVVSAPALGQRWHATREGGAFAADGRRMRVSAVSTFADAQVFTAGDKDLRTMVPGYDAFVEKVWRTRGFGDFWQHILVADGAADVAIDPVLSEYDIAAPMLIVEEAGGRVTTLAGAHDMAGGSAVSTNGVLHDAVIAALAATPKTD